MDRRKEVVRALPAMTRRIAPVGDSLQREMTKLWGQYDDAQLAIVLAFLIKSCDLAVEEIAKLQSGAAAAKRAQASRKRRRDHGRVRHVR